MEVSIFDIVVGDVVPLKIGDQVNWFAALCHYFILNLLVFA